MPADQPAAPPTMTPEQALKSAMRYHGAGQLTEAEAIYRRILETQPENPMALHLLGVIAHQVGKNDLAVDLITKALALEPNYLEAHYNLGNAFYALGRLEDAIASYQGALAIKPDYPEAHCNLGNSLKELGRLDEAVEHYSKAVAINPDHLEAHYSLGVTLFDLEKFEDAATSYQKALAINPDFAEAHNNFGNALKELGRLNEAVTSYHKALAIKPELADTHRNLGTLLLDQGKIDEAVERTELALSFKPDKDGWRISKALFLPVIPSSQEDIQTRRDTLARSVAELMSQNLSVLNPVLDVAQANFYLAYHSQNNKDLLQDIAKLHIAACPKLTYEAKHCHFKERSKKEVLRIGFLSPYFRDHTVGKLSRGIIENFSRESFEVILFRASGRTDYMSDVIDQAADKVVSLKKNLELDWKTIEDEKLDILFYLDIGMNPYTYYLSFARLAPVQAVTIGHAETSGVPNIDYFLSSEMTEPADASEHYSETLIKLSCLPTYYYRPEAPSDPFSRRDYGLSEDERLYVYPQSLFKIHPDFDAVFGELLRRDPGGRLVLIDDGKDGNWRQLLIERFQRSFPDAVERVTFLPRMPYEKFLGLLLLADALLDNPYLSGTNSGLEAFGVGAPMVAWPGKYCSGRCVTACYNQMGLSNLIAEDEDSYLKLVLRLAQDVDFKHRMEAEINANSHKLFETHETVREMESFFIAAYEAWRTGEPLA